MTSVAEHEAVVWKALPQLYPDSLECCCVDCECKRASFAALAAILAHVARLEEALGRGWETLPRFTLCSETGAQAVAGQCPLHSSDGCLFEYVQVDALRRAALARDGRADQPEDAA